MFRIETLMIGETAPIFLGEGTVFGRVVIIVVRKKGHHSIDGTMQGDLIRGNAGIGPILMMRGGREVAGTIGDEARVVKGREGMIGITLSQEKGGERYDS